MTTLIAVFIVSMVLALILTPLAAKAAKKLGVLDFPSERKVHQKAVPRAGGLAIYLSFYLSFVPMLLLGTKLLDFFYSDVRLIYVVAGAGIIFLLGLIDDIWGVRANTKILVQVFSALVAYMGGIQIHALQIPMFAVLDLGWLSLPATVLWVLLVVNAVNLIDGLDGLATGVTFFVCMVLIILCVMIHEQLKVAILLASLAGSTLGFLRYNFNPASIFLGDSGSYFLGYMLATLSMFGSIKGHAAVAILIPMIALGIPLMDTIWSSIRRFIRGQRIFKPDMDHFHHRLIKIGFSHRRAVLLLYGFTVLMGTVALLMVQASDQRSALLLFLVGAIVIFGIRKLGYLEYLAMDKIMGWVNDITDEMGFNRDRRTFLAQQIDISQSQSLDEFWKRLIEAAQLIGLDYIELKLGPRAFFIEPGERYVWHSEQGKGMDLSSVDLCRTMYISLPLDYRSFQFGTLVLAMNLSSCYEFSTQILRRIEHLRRTTVQTISRLAMQAKMQDEKTGGQRSAVGDQKSAARDQRAEDGGQTSEVGGQGSAVGDLTQVSGFGKEFHPGGTAADGYKANGKKGKVSRKR
ncbi:MAG: undecaprenyl/decaprenyl-phosphate alpha-N-acetylglucosaminyl 1-phosphate transferase [Desulfobacteraceae bacterium]|nr:MAG: undecaprenyl/decaprenyl-phosphate alpha-N-acetylglucosaminyl 1-phosphate transferase [Desulfobacteraceae bacterium]